MTAQQLEAKIWQVEGIRVVIRVGKHVDCNDYAYVNASSDNWRISELANGRIRPAVKPHDFIIVQGNGTVPSGHMLLRTLRATY